MSDYHARIRDIPIGDPRLRRTATEIAAEADAEIAALSAERDAVLANLAVAGEVISAFIQQEVDFMTVNHLGDPERQHNVKWGRQVLAAITPDAKGGAA